MAGVYTEFQYTNREEWLKHRIQGIGASEASAVLGLSPYMNNLILWKIKTGLITREEISNNKNVIYGTQAEEYLRKLFELDYPQYDVSYSPYKILQSNRYPFMTATLDGELFDRVSGEYGVLEIKTCEINQSSGWKKWDKQIPQHYYCQLLHQLAVTGYGYAILKAQLKYIQDDEIRLDTRHYRLSAEDVRSDIDYLISKEQEFWEYVTEKKQPPLILPEI